MTNPMTGFYTGETHTVEEFVWLSYVDLDWKNFVKTNEKFYRPNKVNHLLGDPTKAKTILG